MSRRLSETAASATGLICEECRVLFHVTRDAKPVSARLLTFSDLSEIYLLNDRFRAQILAVPGNIPALYRYGRRRQEPAKIHRLPNTGEVR